jgi:hypothetical protein
MKAIYSILALISFISFARVDAQSPWQQNIDPEKRAAEQTELMTVKVSLSDAQAVKVKEILLKYQLKMKDARDNFEGEDRSQLRGTMTAIRTEQDVELRRVLTTDQFDTWAKYQEEERQKMFDSRKPQKEKVGEPAKTE